MAIARKSPPKRNVAEEQLDRYRSMRDFHVTAEPSGAHVHKTQPPEQLFFVVQKHAATRLHYDFRLAWNGVLKSWAVTKGPSYFPGDKRLAVQVEDHPLEYGGFEGIIPKGQYGGGAVMVWDRGAWEPHVDPEEGLKKGSLKFSLYGEKMKGKWALVRMGGRAANESKPNWLLIKEHDEFERGADETPITEAAPDSAASGRDMEAIAKAGDRVWTSSGEQKQAAKPKAETPRKTKAVRSRGRAYDFARALADIERENFPNFIAPQLASLAKAPPRGDRWLYEIKFDGYRIQAQVQHDNKPDVHLLTRTGLDWTHRMKPIANAVASLGVKSAVFDGEVVVLLADGTSSFAALQAVFQEHAEHTLIYYVFDLLHLDGHNLRGLPLTERRDLLAALQEQMPEGSPVRLSQNMSGEAETIFEKACQLGAEGIIAKRSDRAYISGRGGDWMKLKCHREQELVIGGFTLPSNGIHGVGALLLGYYRDGALLYAGRSGTGFTQKTHRTIRDRLDSLLQPKSPFKSVPADARRGARWVKPELVAQISFSNWTADNLVRQAAFRGLREDKPARSVQREEATEDASEDARMPPPAAKRSSSVARKPENAEAFPIRLTHPDKVLDSASGLTKAGLADYYRAVAEEMLPYVAGRPLTLVRCVDGSDKPCFYQKHKNEMLPKDIGSIEVANKKTGKLEPFITLSTGQAIVELAQIGVLEVHPWGSRNESLDMPDRIVFDLDPDVAINWQTLASSADELRKRLDAMGLTSFLKTTGGKGLHIVVPIVAEHAWPLVKKFAHDVVLAMERDFPSLFLTRMTKAARTGKIYLDYLRTDRGSTSVAPFSPRARAGIPVSLPLGWSELKSKERPSYTVSTFAEWRKRLSHNPWEKMAATEQRLALSKDK